MNEQDPLITAYNDIQNFIPTIPEFPPGYYSGRGIVICAGGPKYNPSAYLTVYTLREVLHCDLPIEWYHNGPDEMPDNFKESIKKFGNIRIIDASLYKTLEGHDAPITDLSSYRIKPFAILVSGFAEILLIDADSIPVKNPSFLFDHPTYRKYGNLFMPDFEFISSNIAMNLALCPGGQAAFHKLHVQHPTEVLHPESGKPLTLTESGEILIDKKRFWKQLNLTWWLNGRSNIFYQYFFGDKDLYWIAFEILEKGTYYQNPHRPDGIGGNQNNLIHTIVQHDPDGTPLFYHRTLSKWETVESNALLWQYYYKNITLCDVANKIISPIIPEFPHDNGLQLYQVPKIHRELELKLLHVFKSLHFDNPQNIALLDSLSIEKIWELTVNNFKNGQHLISRKSAKYLLKKLPNNQLLYNMIGLTWQKSNNLAKAEKYFLIALDKPHNTIGDHQIVCRNFINNTFRRLETSEITPTDLENKFNRRDPIFNRCLGFIYFYDIADYDKTVKYYLRGDTITKLYAQLRVSKIFSTSSAMYGERKIFEENLTKILMNIKKKKIAFSQNEIEEPHFIGFNYFLAYQDRNNAPLHSRVNMLYRNIFPQLTYTSKHVEQYNKTGPKIKKPYIAFVSTNFGNHSVTRNIIGIIEHIDRTKFDIACCWFTSPPDHLAQILWNMPQKKNILFEGTFLNHRSIMEKQEFDAIIYCDIGMHYETYFLACCRLAPVQLTTWGHSDTSGINHTMDYYISSKVFEIPNYEAASKHYTEKLICLDSMGTYYYKPNYTFSGLAGSFDQYFPPGKHHYVCTQYLFKYSPDFINIIINIANTDKLAHFVFIELGTKQDKERLYDILRYEMDVNNITFVPKILNHEKYMYLLSRAPFLLDTYPFGGCNSSLEAFSLGIPIITMPSQYLNGRFTYGFYQQMGGITDMIVETTEQYIQLAIRCQKTPEILTPVRERILANNNKLFYDQQSVTDWENMLSTALEPFIA